MRTKRVHYRSTRRRVTPVFAINAVETGNIGIRPEPVLFELPPGLIRSAGMSAISLRIVEGISMDKSKALDAALSQIERAFGKGSIMRLGQNEKVVEIATVPTGSLGLDIALGVGGLPRGRIIE